MKRGTVVLISLFLLGLMLQDAGAISPDLSLQREFHPVRSRPLVPSSRATWPWSQTPVRQLSTIPDMNWYARR